MEQVILDVREQEEFAAEHIQGSIWVPLSQFGHTAPGVLQSLLGRKLLIMCRSGNRAKLALEQITQLGFGGQVSAEVYQGGILEWARQGKPLITRHAAPLPIMRQVQITAGLIVLASVVLGFTVAPAIAWVAAFVGAGLTFAGVTGFCGLAKLLALMPWNKAVPEQDCRCG
ncbi:MAG: rhodanese-like domain-containing protein [Elusimicrobia bacterium]|nr:rhodanese-like domain-containing protein [Elusimicrobiota bacterium]